MILTVKKINHNYEIRKRMIITVKLKKNDYNHEIKKNDYNREFRKKNNREIKKKMLTVKLIITMKLKKIY